MTTPEFLAVIRAAVECPPSVFAVAPSIAAPTIPAPVTVRPSVTVAPPVKHASVPAPPPAAPVTFAERILRDWKSDSELRASFGDDLVSYDAFRRADAAGRARVTKNASVIRVKGPAR
jgi:hypothetical protein